MQIIAFGLHKHNISDCVWQRGGYGAEYFYDFIKSLSETLPESEFLFVDASHAREIIAVTEDADELKPRLAAFFTQYLNIQKEKLIYHDLEGPDAVKHFFQLSLGIEPTAGTQQEEFLKRASESIETANRYGFAGPVINRMYQGALMLRGKTKRNGVAIDHQLLAENVKQLIVKIFGDISSVNLLIVGQNEILEPILKNISSQFYNPPRIISSQSSNESMFLNHQLQQINSESELKESLIKCQVVLRMNQEKSHLFRIDSLKHIMNRRKNQPLLIVNLDTTITSESTINRIYNLYMYDISDLQNTAMQTEEPSDFQSELQTELKEFFDWFYSKELYRFRNIVAKSPAMERILEMIARISQTDISVLIQGESGTGKEIIARAIHDNSPRRDKPFVVVNCGALTDTLLESELFGHEKGAFTGATATKKGLFEEAHQGTVFLDEIGDTSPALQVKLLRVLQEGEIKRVGSTTTIQVDVRLIAASNQNLDELVRQGAFRRDLFYRVNVVNIDIPPLRERKEDIIPLADYFMVNYSDKMRKKVTDFTEHARRILLLYSWPGNVRELENAIERAVALAIGNVIHAGDLPDLVQENEVPGSIREKAGNQLTLKEMEKEVIHTTLIANNWNYDKVADVLDIGRTTLWRKMKEYGISKK